MTNDLKITAEQRTKLIDTLVFNLNNVLTLDGKLTSINNKCDSEYLLYMNIQQFIKHKANPDNNKLITFDLT